MPSLKLHETLSVCNPTKWRSAGLTIAGGVDKTNALNVEKVPFETLVAVGDPATPFRISRLGPPARFQCIFMLVFQPFLDIRRNEW